MSETIIVGSSAPLPTTVVCARCGGAIERGLERCPTCGAAQSRPAARGGTGSGLAGHLVGLLGMFLIVAWVWPDVFRHIRLGRIADWLEASGGHRMWIMLPMWITFMAGYGIRVRRTPAATQEARTPFAGAAGGRVVTGRVKVEAGAGIPGVEVRTRSKRWLLTLDTVRERSNQSTRLRCTVVPRRDFHFALLPQNRILKAMTSPRVGGFLLELGRAANASGSPEAEARREARQELSFLMGAPIELGEPEFDHAFLLKGDDEAAVRALFGGLRGVVLELRRPGSWWQISFTAAAAGRTGVLEFLESGVVRDAARLEAVHQAMTRMLETLAAGGFIAEDSASSKP